MRRYVWWLALVAAAIAGAVSVVGALAAGQPPVFWRCVPHEGGGYADAKCSKFALEERGKYEAKKGVTIEIDGFSATGKALELQSHTQPFTLTCAGSAMVGRFWETGAHSVKLTLKGCKSGTLICTSPGMAAKTIASNALSATLGWANEGKFEIGLDFANEAGAGPIAEFECYKSTEKFTSANLQLRGSMIARLRGNVGTFSKKFTLTFAEGAGTEVESFEGGAPAVPSLYRVQGATEEPIEAVHGALAGSSVGMLAARH
jgi:hypothetical protein